MKVGMYIILNGRINHNGKPVATVMMDGDNIMVFSSYEKAEKEAEQSHFFSTLGYQIVEL